jgi:hypothetical protein
MENSTLIKTSLFNIRVTMVTMWVIVVELLYQTVIEQVSVLECMSSGACMSACGYVLSHLVLNDLASRGPQPSGHLPGT